MSFEVIVASDNEANARRQVHAQYPSERYQTPSSGKCAERSQLLCGDTGLNDGLHAGRIGEEDGAPAVAFYCVISLTPEAPMKLAPRMCVDSANIFRGIIADV